MREEKQKVLSYLLNDENDVQSRISVCNQLEEKFPISKAYEAIPKIREALQKYDESPSLDFIQEKCDHDYGSFEQEEVTKLSDVLHYIEKDWENYIGKNLLNVMRTQIDGEDKDPRKLIRDVKETLNEFDEKLPQQEELDFMEAYRRRKEMGEGILPYNSVIENYIEEYPKGTISVLAGAPGHMKTTVALHELRKNVFDGKNVVYLSLEMDKDLIWGRIYSAYSFREEFKGEPFYGIEEKRIIQTDLTEEEEEGLENVIIPAVHGGGGNFAILNKPDVEGWRASGLRSTMAKLDFDPDTIFVDHIHEFKEADIPEQYINQKYPGDWLVTRLTALENDADGSGLPVHIRVLSQVTKEGEKEARESDGEYHQSDIWGLSSLVQSASFIMFLWGPQELLNAELCKMHITKNRYGKKTESPEQFDVLPGQGRVAEGRNFEGHDGESINELDDEEQAEFFEQDIETDIPH